MKRILAISLLLIFIAGQVNLTWVTHYCGNFAIDNSISLGEEKLTCGMLEYCCNEESGDADGPVIANEDCCSNDFYSVDCDAFFNKAENSIENKVIFTASFVIAFFNLTQNIGDYVHFIASSPPLIQPDKQVLYQTFLI